MLGLWFPFSGILAATVPQEGERLSTTATAGSRVFTVTATVGSSNGFVFCTAMSKFHLSDVAFVARTTQFF